MWMGESLPVQGLSKLTGCESKIKRDDLLVIPFGLSHPSLISGSHGPIQHLVLSYRRSEDQEDRIE